MEDESLTGIADIPELERITFFKGQRLTDRDLTELQRAQQELRWLHHRALHAWGIGIGLDVRGERGDTAVTVETGYGTDCRGREILLTEPRTITVPAVAGGPGGAETIYYLVAAYQSNDEQKVAERRPGVCLPEGTVRLSEEPLVEWRKPEKLLEGHELVLAQAWIRNCQLSRPLSLAPRRFARPAQQPYIAAGRTGVETTVWELWGEGAQNLGVLTHVNTSEARFTTTPNYMAHVAGARYLLDDDGLEVLISGIAQITDTTSDGFTLRVRTHIERSQIVGDPPVAIVLDLPSVVRERLRWHVVWMGIEG